MTEATVEDRDNHPRAAQHTHTNLVSGAHLGEQEVGVRDPDPLVQAAPLGLGALQNQRRPRRVAVGSLERRVRLSTHTHDI